MSNIIVALLLLMTLTRFPRLPILGYLYLRLAFLLTKDFLLRIQFNIKRFFLYKVFGGPAPLKDTFTVTSFSFSKGMDYLHSLYPDKNDAEILQIRDKENYDTMKAIVKGQFGGREKVESHFVIKSYYSFDKPKELVIQMEPKTKFANAVLIEVMNNRMKNDKYTNITEEE